MSTAADTIQRMRIAQRRGDQKTGLRTLFNASPEPVAFMHSGNSYIIPPNGPGKMPGDNEVRVYDGTLAVYDQYGIDPTRVREARIAAKAGVSMDNFQKHLVISSLDIVDHAVKKLAQRGVVCLSGIPSEDAELRKQAAEAWVAFRLLECEGIMAKYDARRAVFYAQPRNADQPPPVMEPAEEAAFVWMAEYRLGRAAGIKKLVCPVHQCGFQHQDASVMDSHMAAFHANAAPDLVPQTLEARKRGRPPLRATDVTVVPDATQ